MAKLPKDLKLKIGSKEEKFWTDVRDKAVADIEQNTHLIEINKVVKEHAERRIKEEKETFK